LSKQLIREQFLYNNSFIIFGLKIKDTYRANQIRAID